MKLILIACLFVSSAFALDRSVGSKQIGIVELNVSVTSAGVDSGFDKFLVDTTKTATGTYTLAHTKVPFAQKSISFVVPVEAACSVKTITETATATAIVMAAADSSTAKDCGFNAKIIGSTSSTQYGL
jgi:hypothetical protein